MIPIPVQNLVTGTTAESIDSLEVGLILSIDGDSCSSKCNS